MLDIRQLTYEFRSDFRLRLNQDLPTSTLRGALGYAMADVLAYEHSLPVERDKIELFRRYFAPSTSNGNGNRQDGVRPFVIRGGFTDPSQRSFTMQMLLFGQAAQLETLTDLVVERMATRGVGGGRHFGVPCRLRKLDSQPMDPHFPNDADRLLVDFISPTRIKSEGELCHRDVPFYPLAARLVDRFHELVQTYGNPDDRDWSGWRIATKQAGEAIQSLRLEGKATHARRRSTRTGGVCELSGFVGRMLYQGNFQPLSEVLAYLPFIHVGKSAPFGCGWCVLECVSSSTLRTDRPTTDSEPRSPSRCAKETAV
ncbi:MAG: CRISPR system precrRNA processing endoribonuclease RAMP protein Cas6 [Lentisphaerae bacterium]|jgi:hypothetical protein|nr:CRISPR system precrRNA processing endoribonuclease RAMP protein Cas6 [Lentisphaerota bacterium]MBT4815581.1 CRISPR system precrRNA processing endoribonuclease RAMP protein Cas6 [Lentisphaerota bacterium]MBT5608942.1 CRISPR system precrRNA processing endoribonuclease RAMP protein Cas6 [Lentisphaerota bacterium]MBT7061481.1 CRISPR system precrRNA processing endoribonuclease RAMP protein Cas6 [Lentisphaerota bacterium]MBT7845039.1 CRISPR system precrRNA processing endoribonuclease RAMP protein 